MVHAHCSTNRQLLGNKGSRTEDNGSEDVAWALPLDGPKVVRVAGNGGHKWQGVPMVLSSNGRLPAHNDEYFLIGISAISSKNYLVNGARKECPIKWMIIYFP